MNIKKIRLQEAMTRAMNQRARAWEVPGLQIEDKEIPENVVVIKTFVMKLFDNYWQVGVEWNEQGEKATSMKSVAEFSTLEEIRERFPHLFELVGDLYAFS